MSTTIHLTYPFINFPVTIIIIKLDRYLLIRKNQHVAKRLYITYMGNQASTFLFFV